MTNLRVLAARKSKGGRAKGGRAWIFPVMLQTAAGSWTPIYQGDFLQVRDYLVSHYPDANIEYEKVDF